MVKLEFKNEKEICDLYLSGLSSYKIAELFHCSNIPIKRVLKENKIQLRTSLETNRKYYFNEDYFKIIDTKDKAYFLGLLYADGWISLSLGKTGISLQEQDGYILEIFKKYLKGNFPIKFLKGKKDTHSNSFRLLAYSRKMANDLNRLGVFERKSLILKFPTEEQVPSYLIHHFIRGYFDGDGNNSLFRTNKGKLKMTFNITGNKECIEVLQEVLFKNCDLNRTKLTNSKQHKKNTVRVSYGGATQVKRIFDYLYKDATIYLQRKYNKFIIGFNGQ